MRNDLFEDDNNRQNRFFKSEIIDSNKNHNNNLGYE